jgi:hypothetical protein
LDDKPRNFRIPSKFCQDNGMWWSYPAQIICCASQKMPTWYWGAHNNFILVYVKLGHNLQISWYPSIFRHTQKSDLGWFYTIWLRLT